LLIYLQGIESGTFLAFWPSEKVKLFLRKCLAGRYWRTLSRSISPRLDLLKLVFFSRLIRTENSKGETKAGYAWRGGTALLACCRITWQKEKTREIYQQSACHTIGKSFPGFYRHPRAQHSLIAIQNQSCCTSSKVASHPYGQS
jgi:hypothetical protein